MLKNQKMKKKFITGGIALFAILILVLAIVLNQPKTKSKNKKFIGDPELARAMTYDQFVDGDENISGTDNVKFSAFFLRDVNSDRIDEKIKGTCKKVGMDDALHMVVDVQNEGTLKNGKIEIAGNNFYLLTSIPQDNDLKDNYISTNTGEIEFNDLASGTKKELTGKVRSGDYSYTSSIANAIGSNVNNLSRNDNKIIFTGTYVDAEGNSKDIRKEITFSTDWYGTTSANLSETTSTYYDLQDRIDENKDTLTLTADITSTETAQLLKIKKNYVEGTIPQLNGYNPVSVTSEAPTTSFDYNESTRVFKLNRTAETDSAGNIASVLNTTNDYSLKIMYPLDAYRKADSQTLTLEIPMMTYYQGFNNTNSEFTNPYESNRLRKTVAYTYRGDIQSNTTFDVKVGTYMNDPAYRYVVSKKNPLKTYNGEVGEDTDTYNVKWYVSKGENESNAGLKMADSQTDKFISGNQVDAPVTNVGISFNNADKFLADDGWIKVYDNDTDELMVTFTKLDWNKYTVDSPYKYDLPIKHIRVETSETQANQYLYIYHQKELDDDNITTNYTKEQFDEIASISSQVSAYLGDKSLGTKTHTANYEAPFSKADLTLSKTAISTQNTENNEILTIKAIGSEANNQVAWKNGAFLVKLPDDIIATKINNIETNNTNVTISNYEYIENVDGKFIKINTSSENAESFEVKIDVNLTPDTLIETLTEEFELYASNEENAEYYYNAEDIYDVNNNLDTTEKVHKSTTEITLTAPNSMVTKQTASNYDKTGNTVVAPNTAYVRSSLSTGERTVKIEGQVKNNYENTVSNVKVLGKIPFTGNTSVVSNQDLNSTFTTQMTRPGIQIPDELQGKVTVYYSEQENPDKDVTKSANGWRTGSSIYYWDKVKTYLIDFQDVKLASGQEYSFNYTVKVPDETGENAVSYSNHGIYFSLDTPDGKYKTQIESHKLGLKVTKQYNLEIQKYQKEKNVLVPGATYKITKEGTDDEESESTTAVTNAQGIIELENLYSGKTYSIEETKAPEDYELNTDVIKFVGTLQDDGSLQVEKTQGNPREEITTEQKDDVNKVIVKVEDEIKGQLKIVKTEKDTDTVLEGVRYKVTGAGMTNGKVIGTNAYGEATLKGLKIGEEYTLEEIKATGYYLASPIKFTITNAEGTYELSVSEGTTKESTIAEENNIPRVTMKIEDDKKPTYNLEISKIKRITDTAVTEDELKAKAEQALASTETVYLQGAKFKLYKGEKEIGEYTTDENGKVTIEGLYQYIDEKDEEGIYTLREVLTPSGYTKAKDITFKVDGTTGELKLVNTNGENEPYTVDGNTVKLVMEDTQSFKLIKKDAETQQTLANIKFAIYNVDEGSKEAVDSKGEKIGTKETINGKEYYTVTTDSKGEVILDLPEGIYKAVELVAPDKYDLSDATYYFGIGRSVEGKPGFDAIWGKSIGEKNEDCTIYDMALTVDGGYVIVGCFSAANLNLDKEKVLSKNGLYEDAMIIKYNALNEIEWAKAIGGNNDDYLRAVTITKDGGILVGGYFSSDTVELEKGIVLKNSWNINPDDMVIKYTIDGEIEWAERIGGGSDDRLFSIAETSDGGFITGGNFYSHSKFGDISVSSDSGTAGVIVKYNSNREAEWAKVINGYATNGINCVKEMNDGTYIVGGFFLTQENNDLDLGNGVTIGSKSVYKDGIIIKYNADGECQWAKGIGVKYAHTQISDMVITSDGGIVAIGYFEGTIDLENGVSLSSNGSQDGMIIKYNADGECEWARNIGASQNDYISSIIENSNGNYIAAGYIGNNSRNWSTVYTANIGNGKQIEQGGMILEYSKTGKLLNVKGKVGAAYSDINSIREISEGEYIMTGDFHGNIELKNRDDSISIGNGVVKLKKRELINAEILQEESIGGQKNDWIKNISATADGGYISVGYFNSKGITLKNGEILPKNGSESYSDGLIIKYDRSGNIEWFRTIAGEYNTIINTVTEISDGGYIVSGSYDAGYTSKGIDLGNGIFLKGYGTMIIKYNNRGECEWAKKFNASIQSIIKGVNDEIIICGTFSGTDVNLGDGINITSKGKRDGYFAKCNIFGEVQDVKTIGGTEDDYIKSIAENIDGEIVIVGVFDSKSISSENNIIIENKDAYGFIVKYNATGEIEWAKGIGGSSRDQVNSVAETSDGGIIVGVRFNCKIDLGNGIIVGDKKPGYEYSYGVIIKYDNNGECQWAEEIDSSLSDINIVRETSDNGILIGGQYHYSHISVENGQTLGNSGDSDGMIIKYDENGNVIWSKSIGGSDDDCIYSVIETISGDIIVGGYFYSSNITRDDKTLTNKGSDTADGFILRIVEQKTADETEELTVENNRKVFKITTAVEENDGVKGGSITGEDEKVYEKIKYGDSSEKEITMTPDENYEIKKITVNNQEIHFTANEDGTYTMPAFTDVTENKKVVVTYILKDNKITINKVDSKTKEKLMGATFKLDQIEERPDADGAIGELTDNGQEYITTTLVNEANDKLGTLTNNGTYYFVQNEDGTYTPTNSKTYQTANGGTAGIQNVTANSYIPIDLTNETGKYAVVINASCSSEENYDYGYATITENTTAPSYNSSTGRFIYISGAQSEKDYQSITLEGGKTYYLHLGYRKDGSGDRDNDQIIINSIKLYNASEVTNQYNFINNDGKYESTNQGKDSTVANSYIPIDLTQCMGKYNLIVNAEISSESSDYGYVTVTENTTRPSYSDSTGRLFSISGIQRAKDYSTVIQGGKMYYLHLGYRKDGSVSSESDKFIVNSVNITLNDSDLYHTTVDTNINGQAITTLPFGKYSITETKAPEGYLLNETPTIVEFRSTEGAIHEFTIEDEAKGKVIVHHYVKGSTTKVAEDDLIDGKIGTEYMTTPKQDINGYEIEKDETGNSVLPSNATGTYVDGTIEVTYYYVEKEIPLTVHHYIQGTAEPAPLKDGSTAEDENQKGKQGENYTTSVIPDDELSDDYELATIPENASGIYNGNEVIVTYYYKKVVRNVVLQKYKEDGITPLEGAKFNIRKKQELILGEMQKNGTYYFEEKDGKYVSNNKYTNFTKANSYMKIDLTNAKEDVNLIVNAEIASITGYQWGYATITGDTTAPSYNNSNGRFIYISGTQKAKDYSKELEKGKIYYLHFGYDKRCSSWLGADIFTINSIKLVPPTEEYITDKEGRFEAPLTPETYEITEVEAPEKYKLPDNPTTEITITKATPETINITNERITGTVTVHHYLEGTTTKLIEDETKVGNVGDIYATKPNDTLLATYNVNDEPENSSGTYTEGNIEVTYYYSQSSASVLVHHYLEGTTTKLAEDETIEGKAGDEYTTSPAEVDSKYELVETPANASGTMTKDPITVTYYYKMRKYPYTVNYLEKDTNKVLHIAKTGEEKEYGATINTADEVIDINGYKYDSTDKETLTIGTTGNTINIYYTKRNDLSYKVNYLERDTDEVLHEQKVQGGMTFGDTIAVEEEIIPIDGYKYDSTDTITLEITTGENVINIYYTKRDDLSYTVNYLEKDTNKVIHEPKLVEDKTLGDIVNTADEKIAIDGYYYNSVDKDTLTITADENVINIYYTKRNDLGYTVNYLEKDTNNVIHAQKIVENKTFEDTINTADEKIEIDGYNYDSVDKDTLKITTGENVINIYYTKRNDLSYKVNYLEKDTNKTLHDQKVVNGKTFGDTVTSTDEKIDIDGYKFDSVDKETLTIGTGENIINIYYTKRNDLSYKVNYLEKDTNKTLHDQKTVENKTFGDTVTSADEKIDIDGYKFDSVDKETLTIGTGENIINIYYTKRNDLSYKVNYLEKTTNKVLHEQKVQNGMTFETEIKSADEVIEINGYKYDSADKTSMKITTGENIINIYYTKVDGLSYTVNYLEKGINKVIAPAKTQDKMTFEDIIDSSKEVIKIDGYNYDSVDKATLTITIGENVINIYYTKRNDLGYTVNYLEKDTNNVIHAQKLVENKTFEDTINTADEKIEIDGYNYDSVDKDTLKITTGENVINIYYTKRNDLSYKVNYLEKDTNKTLHDQKVVNGKTFKDTVNSEDEKIDIDGYKFDSVDKETLTIGAGENVINIYYTKRNDLSYKVNYLEKDTNNVLHEQKVQDGMTFEDTVNTEDEKINIDGYKYDSADKDTLTITTGENIINIYYTKITGLSYKVNYLEKGTNNVLHESKVTDEMTYGSVVKASDEVIEIYGYNYNSVDKETLTIGTGENVINIYYTKKDAKVTVHYYEENSTNKVSEDIEINGKVFDNYSTSKADNIPSKYELVTEPENKSGKMTEDEIVVIYYFRKKASKIIVHYYEQGTTNKLSEDVTINGRVDDSYETVSADDIPAKYTLVAEPENKTGIMTEDTIEVIYYYQVKEAVVNVRYLEKGTDEELADSIQLKGKVDEEYQTEAKEIKGYQLVEHSGNESGKFEAQPLEVTYYYLYKTKATVQYIDKTTGQILEQSTTEGLEGDDFITESKTFENYILVEEPEEKTVKMTKDEIILKYYYIHVSGGVIEKHIDEISGEVLANQVHEGKAGDKYDIKSRTFEGYDLVKDKLPTNAKGTMTGDSIEVIYYYKHQAKVTAEYVDKNTGKKLAKDEVQNGHEKDAYTTERKTFDDYKLVEVPANADGEMTKEDITVTYNYVHTSGGVVVNHIDAKTGEQLLEETKIEGYEGDPYETQEANIQGYDLVENRKPKNAEGTMTKDEIRVTYYYSKKSGVTVKYVDKETGKEIENSTEIEGHEGDDYETEAKEIAGYDLIEEPENKAGTMIDGITEVVYYYKRPAKVVVNYYDEETNEKIAEEITIEGHENDKYETEQKDIKYHIVTKTAENPNGTMKIKVTKDENGKEIVENITYVNYYYRKMVFNMKVDKTVESIIVDGQEQGVNGDIGKVEIHRKNLSTAKVQVKYKIAITNDSELTGKAVIMEDIPSGMIMKPENNPGWDIKEATATRETEEMKPGETQEYQVVLDWNNGENNIGMKENTATITTQNEAGFGEKDMTDNEDKADIIVAVGTGEIAYTLIAYGVLIIVLAVTAGVYIIKRVGVEK